MLAYLLLFTTTEGRRITQLFKIIPQSTSSISSSKQKVSSTLLGLGLTLTSLLVLSSLWKETAGQSNVSSKGR